MMKVTTVSDFVPVGVLAAMEPKQLATTLSAVMAGARSFWISQASALGSTRREYIEGIQPVHQEGTVATLDLVGVLPNMVEQGQAAFDMRTTMLIPGARGVKTNKAGRLYRSIPFRHQTPGTLGVGGGAPMGDPYRGVVENAAALGRDIYSLAKRLKPGQQLPAGYAPKLKEIHSTDIYADMLKVQAKGRSHVYYRTFRTISQDSPPEVWLHPGIEARHFVDPVADYVMDVAEKAFTAMLLASLGNE